MLRTGNREGAKSGKSCRLLKLGWINEEKKKGDLAWKPMLLQVTQEKTSEKR